MVWGNMYVVPGKFRKSMSLRGWEFENQIKKRDRQIDVPISSITSNPFNLYH